MPKSIEMPISNILTGSDYTGRITVGDKKTRLNVLLDTGSSTLMAAGHAYDPTKDPGAKTTKMAQLIQYGEGSCVGAVVETSVGLSAAARLSKVNLVVTYQAQPGLFGKAQGILGLAYEKLNYANLMPSDTWRRKYDVGSVKQAHQEPYEPYFDRLEEAGLIANKFAFYTKRSIMRAATKAPASDPMNRGVFVVGGGDGPERRKYCTGAFTSIAVLHDVWYNTKLLSVRVGSQPPIPVAPRPRGGKAASNSIVDSGAKSLVIDQDLYEKILASFHAIQPSFAKNLQKFAINTGKRIAQSKIVLDAWPDLHFVFQGADGKPATLTIAPNNYWQFDALKKGVASASIRGDDGETSGQSALGLPLFSQYYTVFDRTAARGKGVIRFATRI